MRVRAVFDTEETKSTGGLNRIVAEAKSPQVHVGSLEELRGRDDLHLAWEMGGDRRGPPR